ncbi:MAG: PAS domain S-box protein, partial [Dehalococcoidia bacterium]
KIVQQWIDRWFFRERYDALKALDAFSRDTQSLSNAYSLASTMVQLITNALNTKSAYLLLLTHTRDAYSTVSFSGLNNVYSGISVKSTSLLVKWLDRYGSILLIQDMEMAPQLQGITAHEKQALDDINAHIIIPLKVPDQPLFGMLILGPKRSDEAYTIEDKQLLTTISNQMTMKLYNLQLYTNILHSRENIQAWINTMPDCIIVVSSDSTIEFMNLAATKQFGDRIGEIYSQVINDEVKYIYYSLARTDKQNKVIRRNYLNISGRQYDIEQASLKKIDGTVSEVRILRDITEFKQAEEDLRLRALLLDNATDSIFLYDMDGNFHYVNEAAGRTFGYNKEELLKINYENLLASEKKDSTVLFRKKTADSDYIVIETGLLHKNGSVIPVEIYSRAIISNNKKYFLAAVRDISRRKRNEQELRQSQEKLMRIFQSVGDGISVTDLKGIFTEVNEKTLQLHGYSDASEMIGKNGIEYIAPEDRERVNQYYRQVPIRGANNMEITMLRKDGSTFMAEVNTSIIRNSTNEPTGVISIVRDITERKKAEEELKMRALLLDNATDAIALYDLDKNLHYINKTGEKIYGYSKDELLQMKLEDIFASKGKQVKIADVKKLLKTGYLAFEMNIKSKKGALIPAEFHISLVEINERKYALAVVRDISSRKKAEEERRQLEQKAQRTSQLASVGEMAAGIAHEINNPLTSVIGYAQLLMKKDIPEDIKEDISIIHEGAQRVSGIVNRMLTFARQRKPKREYSDINSIIETTLELREYSLRNNNIKVVRQFAPDLPMTVADNGQLQQVFLNIIVNAETEMKLAHGKGTLIIKTRTKGRKIQISFTDDGPGIAKELLARLFDPFFTTREVGQGTGLGLSVCHGIISEHGGQIYVESVQGKGATFTVELPVIESVDRLDQDNTDISTDYGVKKAKILVVDDEATIRQYLSQLLIREGYKVESVEDAATALEIIRYKRFSLLLLDVKMPSMNGMELYIQLQDIAKSLAKRVLFMTGDTMGEDTYRFFRETGAHYITKPFNETELKEKIRSMLD